MTQEQLLAAINELFPGGVEEFKTAINTLLLFSQLRGLEALRDDARLNQVQANQQYESAVQALNAQIASKEADIRAAVKAAVS